jgi:DNA-binding Lrp family transcriptional regulator
METGYIVFNLRPGLKKDFLEKARKIKAVKEVHLVLGNFDAIAEIEAENIQELEKVYFNQIDNIANIRYSRLYIMACPRTRK